jgi:hypothetical protein
VRLSLAGPGRSEAVVDHVIAGTGFRIDVARLGFLPEALRSQVRMFNGQPAVSRVGETSVPGLYFAGAHTVLSVGPSSRFIAGTHTISALQARSIARRARGGAGSPAAARHALAPTS